MHKTLTLIIAALIIYSIVKTKMDLFSTEDAKIPEVITEKKETVVTTQEDPNKLITGNFLEKTISKVIVNALKTPEGRMFFENLMQPMDKSLNSENYVIEVQKDLVSPLFKITTFGEGSIGPATCGHVVTVRYQIADSDNNLMEEGTKTYTLGSKPIMPGMDNVIVGMMVGQTRQAIIPSAYAYYKMQNIDPANGYRLNIALQSILPKNFIKNNEVKIFDNEIAYRIPLLCGDKVSFDAKITRLSNGKVLYNSQDKNKQIDMKIGDITYPLIFSYALQGKVPVGTRSVVAKANGFKATGTKVNNIIDSNSLSSDEYLLLEISNFKTN